MWQCWLQWTCKSLAWEKQKIPAKPSSCQLRDTQYTGIFVLHVHLWEFQAPFLPRSLCIQEGRWHFWRPCYWREVTSLQQQWLLDTGVETYPVTILQADLPINGCICQLDRNSSFHLAQSRVRHSHICYLWFGIVQKITKHVTILMYLMISDAELLQIN